MATWQGVPGATGYRLDVATDRAFTRYVEGYRDLDVGNVTGRSVTGLSGGTTYYYRVRAYDAASTSASSQVTATSTAATAGLVIHAYFDRSITANPNAAGWKIAGAADFNRDGKADYLLFNAATRQSKIIYLSGGTVLGAQYGPTIDTGYELVGAGDFNGDSKPDYVLFNPSTGQTQIWYLDNYLLIGKASGPTLPAGWTLAAP